jgi:hypothetical protein
MNVRYHGAPVSTQASRLIMPGQLVGFDKKLFADGIPQREQVGREGSRTWGIPPLVGRLGHATDGGGDSSQVSRGQLVIKTMIGLWDL